MTAVSSRGSKASFVVGVFLATLTTAVAMLFWSAGVLVLPVIGVISLTVSWLWPHKMLRGFLITMIVLAVVALLFFMLPVRRDSRTIIRKGLESPAHSWGVPRVVN